MLLRTQKKGQRFFSFSVRGRQPCRRRAGGGWCSRTGPLFAVAPAGLLCIWWALPNCRIISLPKAWGRSQAVEGVHAPSLVPFKNNCSCKQEGQDPQTPRAPRLWVQRARVHLQRVCQHWLTPLGLGAIRLTATAAPRVWPWFYGVWPSCTALCRAPPTGAGRSTMHSTPSAWIGMGKKKSYWMGRQASLIFLECESNTNRMVERRNFPWRQLNPQLHDVGFLATSFKAACAGHCRRWTVELTVIQLICYGYSCIPDTIQENEIQHCTRPKESKCLQAQRTFQLVTCSWAMKEMKQ